MGGLSRARGFARLFGQGFGLSGLLLGGRDHLAQAFHHRLQGAGEHAKLILAPDVQRSVQPAGGDFLGKADVLPEGGRDAPHHQGDHPGDNDKHDRAGQHGRVAHFRHFRKHVAFLRRDRHDPAGSPHLGKAAHAVNAVNLVLHRPCFPLHHGAHPGEIRRLLENALRVGVGEGHAGRLGQKGVALRSAPQMGKKALAQGGKIHGDVRHPDDLSVHPHGRGRKDGRLAACPAHKGFGKNKPALDRVLEIRAIPKILAALVAPLRAGDDKAVPVDEAHDGDAGQTLPAERETPARGLHGRRVGGIAQRTHQFAARSQHFHGVEIYAELHVNGRGRAAHGHFLLAEKGAGQRVARTPVCPEQHCRKPYSDNAQYRPHQPRSDTHSRLPPF